MSLCCTMRLLSICVCFVGAVSLRSGSMLTSFGSNSQPSFSFAVTHCYTQSRPAAIGSENHPILAESGLCNACTVNKTGYFQKVNKGSSDVTVHYNGHDQGRMTTVSKSSAWACAEKSCLGVRYMASWSSDEVVFMVGRGGSQGTCTVKAKILTDSASVATHSEPSLVEVEDSVAQAEGHSIAVLHEASSSDFDLAFETTACYTTSKPGKINLADHDKEDGQILSDNGICNACKLGVRGIIFPESGAFRYGTLMYNDHCQGSMSTVSPFTSLGCTHATCKNFRYVATKLGDEITLMLGQNAGNTCTVKGKILGSSGRHPAWKSPCK